MPSLTPIVRALLIVWAALWLLSSFAQPLHFHLETWLGLQPLRFPDAASWPGLIGYAFLHAPFPELWHVLANGLVLYYFGGEVEALYPGSRFLRFLLVVILAGAAADILFSRCFPASAPALVVGGSGVVNAVLAVNTAVYPGRMVNLIFVRLPLRVLFPVWLALDLLGAWYMALGSGYGVAADVHLAGAAVGWIWARGLGGLRLPGGAQARERRHEARERGREAAERERAARGNERVAGEDAELDRILAKIGREGIGSLTPGERRFLEKRSRGRG